MPYSIIVSSHKADDSSKAFFAAEGYIVYRASIFPGLLIHQWDLQLKYLGDMQYVSLPRPGHTSTIKRLKTHRNTSSSTSAPSSTAS